MSSERETTREVVELAEERAFIEAGQRDTAERQRIVAALLKGGIPTYPLAGISALTVEYIVQETLRLHAAALASAPRESRGVEALTEGLVDEQRKRLLIPEGIAESDDLSIAYNNGVNDLATRLKDLRYATPAPASAPEQRTGCARCEGLAIGSREVQHVFALRRLTPEQTEELMDFAETLRRKAAQKCAARSSPTAGGGA